MVHSHLWHRPQPGQCRCSGPGPRNTGDAVHPHNLKGAYLNFMMEEGEERIRATYGDNYHPPECPQEEIMIRMNFFRVNQNIPSP